MAHMEAAMLPRPVAMAHLPMVMLLVGTAHQEVGMVPPTVATAMATVAVVMDVQTVTAPQALLLEAVAMVATMPPTVEATKTVRASPSPCF